MPKVCVSETTTKEPRASSADADRNMIAGKIQKEHPGYGAGFAAMAVATVALNELVGPILFKAALDRSGESATHADTVESAPAAGVEPAR